jgi:hypothetical protein
VFSRRVRKIKLYLKIVMFINNPDALTTPPLATQDNQTTTARGHGAFTWD